jgi:hypothetical protein
MQAADGKNDQAGKYPRFGQSSPEHYDHLALLISKKILWSTEIGRGWSGTLAFPAIPGNPF